MTAYERWREKAIAALQESIAHWERIADGDAGDSPVSSECACCEEFLYSHAPENNYTGCLRCPISIRTGLTACDGTPYVEAARYWQRYPPKFLAAARLEADYLRETLRMVETGEVRP